MTVQSAAVTVEATATALNAAESVGSDELNAAAAVPDGTLVFATVFGIPV